MWTSVVLSSSTIATTFGRTALLAIVLVGASYGVGWFMHRRNIMGISAAAILLPLTATGLLLRSGWLVRAAQSANLDLTTRDALAARAIEMIRSSPLTGIGPVQYGPHLTRMGLSVLDPHVVHNLPLLVSAEFGVIVGAAFTLWIGILGFRAFRLSVFAAAIFLSIIPFLMLDNLHYVYGNGMAMFAIWLAMLDYNRDAALDVAEGPKRVATRSQL
jgi:O-antigen ligase